MRLDDWLKDLDDPDADVDELVAQITIDTHGDEGFWSFRQAFEDHIDFPVGATFVGVEVAVTEISFDDERRGLTATVQREDHTSTVSLLDLDLVDHHDRLARLTHAYRHRLAHEQQRPRGTLDPGRQPNFGLTTVRSVGAPSTFPVSYRFRYRFRRTEHGIRHQPRWSLVRRQLRRARPAHRP